MYDVGMNGSLYKTRKCKQTRFRTIPNPEIFLPRLHRFYLGTNTWAEQTLVGRKPFYLRIHSQARRSRKIPPEYGCTEILLCTEPAIYRNCCRNHPEPIKNVGRMNPPNSTHGPSNIHIITSWHPSTLYPLLPTILRFPALMALVITGFLSTNLLARDFNTTYECDN